MGDLFRTDYYSAIRNSVGEFFPEDPKNAMTYLLKVKEEATNSKINEKGTTYETYSTQHVTGFPDVVCFHFGMGRSIR